MLNCLYSVFNSEVSLFSASTSTLDLGIPSQDEVDDHIAALEAELTVLQAQIDADEEEQSEYDDFNDFDASSHIALQHVVASSQNQCLSPTLSTVRSGSGPGKFCGPRTRTSRSGPLKLDLDPVRLRPGLL